MVEESTDIMIPGFMERVKAFSAELQPLSKAIRKKYKDISKETTPSVDGNGRKIVNKRPDGLDYIIEAYMRDALDKHFPGWSWEMAHAPQFIGNDSVMVSGHLVIIDEHLLALSLATKGAVSPYRKFLGCGGARIQYKRDTPRTPENLVDINKNIKSANANAFKVSINRLTHIGDDIYGKRIEEEGAGTYETVLEASPDASNFAKWIQEVVRIPFSKVYEILGVSSINEIKDFKDAMAKIKQARGIK